MIYDFQFKKLTPREIEAIKSNSRLIDQLLERCPNVCGNPDCKYPLPSVNNFRIPEFGDICELCYQMYQAVSRFAHFTRLHREWKTGRPDSKGGEIY